MAVAQGSFCYYYWVVNQKFQSNDIFPPYKGDHISLYFPSQSGLFMLTAGKDILVSNVSVDCRQLPADEFWGDSQCPEDVLCALPLFQHGHEQLAGPGQGEPWGPVH